MIYYLLIYVCETERDRGRENKLERACHSVHAEVREQLFRVGSLLLPVEAGFPLLLWFLLQAGRLINFKAILLSPHLTSQ